MFDRTKVDNSRDLAAAALQVAFSLPARNH